MKITCPKCSTSYQVPDDYIGAEGRPVRCANCGDTWHAVPEAPAKVTASPAAPADQADDGDNSQDDIDALFDSPAGGEDQSQDDIDALFDSPSGGEDQSQDDIDALFDSPSGGEDQSQDDIDALFDSPSGGDEQSQDDIDSLFDTDDAGSDDGPTVITSENSDDPMMVTGDEDDRFDSPVMDLMDAAAFEAQKKVARGTDIESSVRRKRRKKQKAKARAKDSNEGQAAQRKEWIVGASALAATLILVISLVAAPNFWTRSFPDLASFYDMLGMDINVTGVDIQAVNVELVQKAGAPVIAVEAELVNLGIEPVSLPSVRFSVLGNNDSELYSWDINPDIRGLGPGERKTIKTSVAAPSQAKFVSLRMFH